MDILEGVKGLKIRGRSRAGLKEPYLSFACEKFLSTIVCYKKHFRLGVIAPQPPKSGPTQNSDY